MIIKINSENLGKLPHDVVGIDGTVITLVEFYFTIIAENTNNDKKIIILHKSKNNILDSLTTFEDRELFISLNIPHEEITDLNIKLSNEFKQRLTPNIFNISIKEILKTYLRQKIEEVAGDTLDILTDLKNTQFFFQSLSARYIALDMQIKDYLINAETVPQDLKDQFNALKAEYLPFTVAYTQMIDNDILERTADLKNRWLTKDGQIMKYINRESAVYKLVYNYNKALGNDVDNI